MKKKYMKSEIHMIPSFSPKDGPENNDFDGSAVKLAATVTV
jgi:hypothetical protein